MKKLTIIITVFCFFIYSINGLSQWVNIPSPVSGNLILFDMSFPENQNDVGFTGGSNYTYNGKGKVLKTQDNGLTWTEVYSSTVSGTGIMSLHFTSVSNGFAGMMNGDLITTNDGGANWTSTDIDPASNQGEIDALDFFDSQIGILNTSTRSIYNTIDGGVSWTRTQTPIPDVLDVTFATADSVFAVGKRQEIYRSVNGGKNWTKIYSTNKLDNYNMGVDFLDAMNGIVTSEYGEAFITTDGGSNWNVTQIGQADLLKDPLMKSTTQISVACSPGVVFTTYDGGLSWSDDTTSYNLNRSYNKIERTPNGTEIVCGSGPDGGTVIRKPGSSVSVKEMGIANFELYPNPAIDYLTIELGSRNKSTVVEVYDIRGNKMKKLKLTKLSTILSISELSSGLYLMIVKDDEGVNFKHFVKH
ncbi:MAG: YCF48-related protein [Salibacteraceae bacterium]